MRRLARHSIMRPNTLTPTERRARYGDGEAASRLGIIQAPGYDERVRRYTSWFQRAFFPVMAMLILALVIAVVISFLKFRVTPDGSRRSLVKFALGGLTVGIVGGGLGMDSGIAFFCSYSLGNLCGLAGVFLSGPWPLGWRSLPTCFFGPGTAGLVTGVWPGHRRIMKENSTRLAYAIAIVAGKVLMSLFC